METLAGCVCFVASRLASRSAATSSNEPTVGEGSVTRNRELINRRDFATRSQARTEIFDYIECFYNSQRSHSALNYSSPVDFELLNN